MVLAGRCQMPMRTTMIGRGSSVVRVFLINDNNVCGWSPLDFVPSRCWNGCAVGLALPLKSKQSIHFRWCIWKHPCRRTRPFSPLHPNGLLPQFTHAQPQQAHDPTIQFQACRRGPPKRRTGRRLPRRQSRRRCRPCEAPAGRTWKPARRGSQYNGR